MSYCQDCADHESTIAELRAKVRQLQEDATRRDVNAALDKEIYAELRAENERLEQNYCAACSEKNIAEGEAEELRDLLDRKSTD